VPAVPFRFTFRPNSARSGKESQAPREKNIARPGAYLRLPTVPPTYFFGFGFFLSLQPHVSHIAALLPEIRSPTPLSFDGGILAPYSCYDKVYS
jgi:hypothetical protein